MKSFIFPFALLLASPQEGAIPRPPAFSFSIEQGWSLTADAEGDFPDIQEGPLQDDLNPRFRPPLTRPTFPSRDRAGRPIPRARGTRVIRTSKDPLKLEGSILLLSDGGCRLQLQRIEYWDRSQRYWIEFDGDKVRTHELGGVEKWTGTRAEWTARLDKLEASFLDAYLRAVTPQAAAPAKDRIGLDGAASPEPAWRLFVVTSLEEQLTALLLARLDGVALERKTWPAVASRYPDRPLALTRALVDRILGQAQGTFATEPARLRPGRTLRDLAWEGTELAIPSFGWTDGRAWATEMLKPVEEARRRLRALADESLKTRGLDPDDWRAAVAEEAKFLRKLFGPPDRLRAATMDDALLPKVRSAGPATYDFHEKATAREGQVVSSEADVRGYVRDLEMVFFHSGANVWKTSVVQLETWYKGRVKRTD